MAIDSDSKNAPVPPYVPYKTLKTFLQKFRQGVPGRVDRGLMGSMSGATQSQVKTALKYLGLVSEYDIPSEAMKKLCRAEGDDWKGALSILLREAYPYIFADTSFNFGSATGSQLREQIEAKTSATGETVNRCISFLKDAAEDAGIEVSPFLIQKAPRRSGVRRSQSGRKPDNKNRPTADTGAPTAKDDKPESGPKESPLIAAQASLLLWGLFSRLPEPGSVWKKAERDRWTQTLHNVLELEYKEQ